jgi:hypothetical protein
MRAPVRPRRSAAAWVTGLVVLVALLGAVVWMLDRGPGVAARLPVPSPTALSAAAPPAVTAPLLVPQATLDRSGAPTVRGVVRLPNGEPASGASVTVERAVTAWPEWQRVAVGEATALTGDDGSFQFRVADRAGLLVAFAHPRFAGGVAEVSPHGDVLELPLQPGFPLEVTVTTAGGALVPNARVALESVPGGDRRVAVQVTGAGGRCSFANVAAGPVRLVVRHDAWQPAAQPAVVLGNDARVTVQLTRAALPPLRGRVVSAATQQPLNGATVEVLPLNGKPGLVDTRPVRTGNDGRFELGGLARGSMRLVVRHRDHGASMTTQSVGAVTPELTIELPRRCLVSGRLTAAAARPWRGGEQLQLRDAVGQLAFCELAADGTFRFDAAVSPGWANLAVRSRAFVFQRSFTNDVDVRVEESVAAEFELPVAAPAVLRGRLVDAAGAPLAGAALVRTKLLAEGARTIGDAAVQLDLGMFGSQVVQLFASDRDEVLATTAADGTFAVRAVKPGPLLLRTVAPGHGSRLLRETVDAVGSERDLGAIELPKGRRMQGQVLRGGRAFAGATVTVVGADTQAVAITDQDGRWAVDDLVPGDYRVRARLASQPSGSRVRTERVTATGPTPNVVVVLEAGRTVAGEVTGSDGQPVPGAIVTVVGTAGASTVSDANGDFVLELPDRATALQVALADRSSVRTVDVPGGEQRLQVRLDTPPTGTITATVVGLPGRKLLPAALLRLSRADVDGDVQTRWLELTDGELRWALCPAGRVRIEVWCEGYAPAVLPDVEVAPGGEVRLDRDALVLEPGCRLAGVVRGPDGAPIAGAAVLLGDEGDLELFEPRQRSAADGTFTVTGVTGRSRRLVVRAPGFAARVVDVQLPHDVLADAPLVVTLERGATIEVALGDAALRADAVLQLRRGGRVVATTAAGDDGRAMFGNRAAGAYTVHVAGSDAAPVPVTVAPADTLVRVRLP